MFILNGGAVSWTSSKQGVVAGSTCEAGYIAASEAANEGVWMKEFISDLGVLPSASGPMKIFCDNIGAIALVKSGLFILNLGSDETHIHNIEAKRCRVNNDSATYLWHCRLGHIGVKHMKKLHTDGLLESLDYESFGTCEPFLMGKITKTPSSGTDLLEIIHTNVCGPINIEGRSGHRYFLTFTDDLSRYGYIYLMKHLKSSRNFRVK